MDMTDLLLAGLALAMVIEGAAYALFPDAMRRAMATMLMQPADRIRWVGTGIAAAGVLLLWVVR